MDADTAIRQLVQRYAELYERKDGPALTTLYVEDAVIYTSFGPPARGRKAILAEHAAWFEDGEENKRMSILDLRIDGALAACAIGFAAEAPDRQGGRAQVKGTSLNVLEKDAGGDWRFRTTSLILDPEG